MKILNDNASYKGIEGIQLFMPFGESATFLTDTGDSWNIVPPEAETSGYSPQQRVMIIVGKRLHDREFVQSFLKLFPDANLRKGEN